MKTKALFIILCALSFISPRLVFSQNLQNINPSTLNHIDVESLTDDQIKSLIDKLDQMGMTMQEFEKMALIRGIQPSQMAKLKARINDFKEHPTMNLSNTEERSRIRHYSGKEGFHGITEEKYTAPEQENTPSEPDTDELFRILGSENGSQKLQPKDRVFGMNLFHNDQIRFEPILNIPTPDDYQLGPGDDLVIDIWGVAEQTYNVVLSPEGKIMIPNVGPVYLSGLSIETARQKLKRELSRIYSGLAGGNPNTFMNVSLNSVRSIKVNIVGEVSVPGTYTLPSLASVFNALYAAGGPSGNGSLREVDLVRGNRTVAKIDVYNFLVGGTLDGNIRLQDQDVILLKPYIERVQIEGEVKRPGIYEMKAGENLTDLISYTGGFNGKAYKRRLKIYRKTESENQIVDVPEENFLSASLEGRRPGCG